MKYIQRNNLVVIVTVVVLFAALIPTFYYSLLYPHLRANQISKEIQSSCHIKPAIPWMIIPQTELWIIDVSDQNTLSDIESLCKILRKNSDLLRRVVIRFSGEKWRISQITCLIELKQTQVFESLSLSINNVTVK